MQELVKIAENVISEARRGGADEVDVLVNNFTNTRLKIRLGKVEELRQSNPKALGIRVFKNKRKALTYTSDLRPESISKMVQKALEIVRVSSTDEYNGLPEKHLFGKVQADLKLYDPEIAQIPTERKIKMATELEDLGLKQNPLITNSGGSFWNDSYGQSILVNSQGFSGAQEFSSCSLSLQLVAEKDGVKQTDYWWSGQRAFSQLDSIESIAKTAAARTIRKIGARKPTTQSVPVVYDPQTGADLLAILASVVLGSAIYRKNSFLVDKLNQPIAIEELNIIDDATLPGGIDSRYFDDEGLPARRNIVIENGILKTYLCDCYSARKLKCTPTGSARRGTSTDPSPSTSNFFLPAGKYSPEEIIGSISNGLYLTDLNWVGINYVTGDYSRGAEGIWIENGKLAYPVQEFTVAGNVLEMLKSISMIGNDLEFRGSINSPTFKIDRMMVSGQ